MQYGLAFIGMKWCLLLKTRMVQWTQVTACEQKGTRELETPKPFTLLLNYEEYEQQKVEVRFLVTICIEPCSICVYYEYSGLKSSDQLLIKVVLRLLPLPIMNTLPKSIKL